MNRKEAEERRARAEVTLKKTPGVVGVGLGLKVTGSRTTDQFSLRVFVRRKLPRDALSPADLVPGVVEGLPTDVAEAEKVELMCEDILREHDPLVSGATITIRIGRSLGVEHGTLGFFATEHGGDAERDVVLVSNYHVLGDGARRGDQVYQPRMIADPRYEPRTFLPDPRSRNVVAQLARTKVGNHPYTYPDETISDDLGVDAASAKLDIRFSGTCCRTNQGVSFCNGFRLPGPHGITALASVARLRQADVEPGPGPIVYKIGRKTGLTKGRVRRVNYTADTDEVGVLDKTILIDPLEDNCYGRRNFGERGDSGSAVFDEGGRLVGLFFGSGAGGAGVACHIHPVLHHLGELQAITAEHPGVGPAAATSARSDQPGSIAPVDRTRWLRLKLLETQQGRGTLGLMERHEEEVAWLINHRRHVTVAWHRAQGPAFLNRFLANVRDPGIEIPQAIAGVSRAEMLRAMDRVLRAHGSAVLRADLERHAEQVHAAEDRLNNLHALADELSEEAPSDDGERASA